MRNGRIRLSDEAMVRVVGDEVVFASQNLSDDLVFIHRGVGGVLFWNAIRTGKDFRQAASETNGASAEVLWNAVQKLREAGLVEVQETEGFEIPEGEGSAGKGGPELVSLRVRDLLPKDLVIQGSSLTGGTSSGLDQADTPSGPCPPKVNGSCVCV